MYCFQTKVTRVKGELSVSEVLANERIFKIESNSSTNGYYLGCRSSCCAIDVKIQ